MINKDKLSRKRDSLKSAIERYNLYDSFVKSYNTTNSLDAYVLYIKSLCENCSDSLAKKYESMIYAYNNGDNSAMLSHLFNKLLAADEDKNRIASEIKLILSES
jgi:hypothetical protein